MKPHTYRGQPCFYCGREAQGYDHKVARACGGSDSRDNLVPSCQVCNSRKGMLSLEHFRFYVGLLDQRMPVVFYGEGPESAPVHRDWIYVSSWPSQIFARSLREGYAV